jgi:hypothetical protein
MFVKTAFRLRYTGAFFISVYLCLKRFDVGDQLSLSERKAGGFINKKQLNWRVVNKLLLT